MSWSRGSERAPYSFDLYEDAVADAWAQVSAEIMQFRSMSTTKWNSLSLSEQLFEVAQAFQYGKAADKLETKTKVAAQALQDFDFGEDPVESASGWEYSTGDNVVSCNVYLANTKVPDAPNRRVRFNVEVVDGQAVNVSVSN